MATEYATFTTFKSSASAIAAVEYTEITAGSHTTFTDAIATQTSIADNATTAAAINEATATLKAAINTYLKDAKASNEGDTFDLTAWIVNSGIDGNTEGWTCEKNGNGWMGGPLIPSADAMEFWGSSTVDANAATKFFDYHQTLTSLPEGAYTISVQMFNSTNDEEKEQGHDGVDWNGGGNAGLYGKTQSDEVQQLVYTNGNALQLYTTAEILVFDGTLRIGVKNINPLTGRWFVADNFKLTYVRQLTQEEINAHKVPENITLDPTAANLTIYGIATLTATITPDDAADKSITWTSSDPTVATVDADGKVTAVGVGSATITATANAKAEVKATATITVADVTPAAAPAYYSEIAVGEFYIVNAATGKYLGGANDWGTHASIIEHGIPFTVTASNGKYTLGSEAYNGSKHFFDGTYIDGASTPLYITALSDGKYSISTADGSAFVTAKTTGPVVDNSAVNASSTLAQWYFVSKDNRDALFATATAQCIHRSEESGRCSRCRTQ